MIVVNPDNEKDYENFLREWKSHYPETVRGKGKDKKVTPALKPPSLTTMRILFQYATQGDIPGEHLMAMLSDALYSTFNTSPAEELELIPSTLQYITTYLPQESWGNSEKYGKWLNKLKKSKSFRPTDFY